VPFQRPCRTGACQKNIGDSFNDYRWLYVGSLNVGLGAMAVALAFPPLPLRPHERLQAA